MAFKLLGLLYALAVFAVTVQGDDIVRREAISQPAKRQIDCDAPGYTTCGYLGLSQYCAAPGEKCCSILFTAPEDATCCAGGRYCPAGETCRGCTPVEATTASIRSSAPLTTPPPDVSTRVTYQYFTFTVTYYYYQWYWIYVPALTRSSSTSSRVTTTYVTSVYAENSAAASSSLDAITETASFPVPASATELPPQETSSSEEEEESSTPNPAPSSTYNKASTTEPSNFAPSATPGSSSNNAAQFTGGAISQVRISTSLYSSLGTWLVTFGAATGVLCIFL